ncbi:SIMPL domain-containing protein [Pseudonocardia sp. TMWB2A]|uniref:SIMPL domain-containing protein n=1 Tax=Pseudonocardia sp. TMWB2A TaxID=687430 RepID=UPI00307E5805
MAENAPPLPETSAVSPSSAPPARFGWVKDRNKTILAAAALTGIGLVAGGYLLGDGLVRAKAVDRSVTVRGLAEKDVVADLASWTLSYSSVASDLASAQADSEADTAAIRAYFAKAGFPADALIPAGVNVSSYTEQGVPRITINQRMQFRTTDIARAQKAAAGQYDLVRAGVSLSEGSSMKYSYTKLNDIKSAMVAEATRDARKVAEQFARDSGARVGTIKSASQGYFEINARDGTGEGYGVSDTPNKKVRVVTTIDYYLK